MHYEKAYFGPGDTDYRLYCVYDSGRRQEVSLDQGIYLKWLAAGNEPEVVPYVPRIEIEPAPIPDDRQAIYTQALALLNAAGLTGENLPTSDADAFAKVSAWIDAAGDTQAQLARQGVGLKLAGAMSISDRAGGSYDEFLTWVAAR